MTFEYVSQFQQYFRPGDRYWACGLRLNPKKTRFIRRLEPVLVEFLCAELQDTDARMRANGGPVFCVAPVVNGRPDYKKHTGFNDLHFFRTEQEARLIFRDLCISAMNEIDAALESVQKSRIRVSDMLARYPKEDPNG